MVRKLFIDTNIYLRFFDKNDSSYKKLLKSIIEVKDDVFITRQIENEIERNKLNNVLDSFGGYLKQFRLDNVFLPTHLDEESVLGLSTWNKDTGVINKSIKSQQTELKKIVTNLCQKVSVSEDEVSKSLSELYTFSVDYTPEQLNNARLRKEIGNPPGKKSDTLGDQISWEQLLELVASIDELWIISNDSDYMYEFDKKYYLNPFLYNEIKSRNSEIKLFLFKTLTDGLVSYNKISKKVLTLPEKVDLNESKKYESEKNLIKLFISGSTSDPSLGIYDTSDFRVTKNSVFCPICNNRMISSRIALSPKVTFTEDYYCIVCNRSFKM